MQTRPFFTNYTVAGCLWPLTSPGDSEVAVAGLQLKDTVSQMLRLHP